MRSVKLLCVLIGLIAKSAIGQVNLNAGDTFPLFVTTTVNGQQYALDSNLNTPLVICFWASWNAPSVQILNELKQHFIFINPVKKGKQQENIQFVDFALDTEQEILAAAIKRFELPWPNHLGDFKGWESELVHHIQLKKIPALYIIAPNRKILVKDPDLKTLKNILSNIKLNQALSN